MLTEVETKITDTLTGEEDLGPTIDLEVITRHNTDYVGPYIVNVGCQTWCFTPEDMATLLKVLRASQRAYKKVVQQENQS